MRKRIALIFEEDYLGSYPSFIEAISMLSEANHYVDVIGTSRTTDFPAPPNFPNNVSFHNLRLSSKINRDYPSEKASQEKSITLENRRNSSFLKKLIPTAIKSIIRDNLNFIKL